MKTRKYKSAQYDKVRSIRVEELDGGDDEVGDPEQVQRQEDVVPRDGGEGLGKIGEENGSARGSGSGGGKRASLQVDNVVDHLPPTQAAAREVEDDGLSEDGHGQEDGSGKAFWSELLQAIGRRSWGVR